MAPSGPHIGSVSLSAGRLSEPPGVKKIPKPGLHTGPNKSECLGGGFHQGQYLLDLLSDSTVKSIWRAGSLDQVLPFPKYSLISEYISGITDCTKVGMHPEA